MASAGWSTRAVISVTALLVIMSAAGDAHLASDPAPGATRRQHHCNDSIARCVDGVEWPSAAGFVREIPRRSLAGGGYIVYPAVRQPGGTAAASPDRANPYTRGCNGYNRCRQGTYRPRH